MASEPHLNTMSGERRRHRFLSALAAFIVAAAPILGFYLGIIANLGVMWWLGVTLLLGVFVGCLYSQQAYSLSRLWSFVWVVWKGLGIAFAAIAIMFGLNVIEVQELELLGRIFVGGFASSYSVSFTARRTNRSTLNPLRRSVISYRSALLITKPLLSAVEGFNRGYEVQSASGNRYEVDIIGESCICPDWQQRAPDGGCKHMRQDHKIK